MQTNKQPVLRFARNAAENKHKVAESLSKTIMWNYVESGQLRVACQSPNSRIADYRLVVVVALVVVAREEVDRGWGLHFQKLQQLVRYDVNNSTLKYSVISRACHVSRRSISVGGRRIDVRLSHAITTHYSNVTMATAAAAARTWR